MFDHFLTSILQIILVLDVLAVVAYFVFGGLKRKSDADFGRPRFRDFLPSLPGRWPWQRETVVPARAADFADLRSVLYSFGDGLA